MSKDWRLAVCTRWRPLVGGLLLCLIVLVTGVIEYTVYTAVDEYPARRLERRIHQVKVGMSVAELESTLGPPDSKADRVERESPDHGKVIPDKIVEYRYSAESRTGEAIIQYKGIFVDENTDKIASIQLSRDGVLHTLDSTFWGEVAFLFGIGLMVLVVLIVMLFFRRWCQSVTDADEGK